MKKKILVLPRWYPNKEDVQLGTFIRQQALLMKDDFEIAVIYAQADNSATEKFTILENRKDGIHELVVYFKTSNGPFRKITNVKRYEKAQALALKKISWQPDLCHVHVPWRSAGLALKLYRKYKTPFVITEHWSGHLTGEYLQLRPFEKMLNKAVLQKAKAISCVSQLLQKHFKANTGFDSVVIPNYIEGITSQAGHNKTAATIEILSVSDIADHIKNASGLVRSFHEALKQNPSMRLTIIGGGPDEDKIRSLVQSLKIEAAVTLKGRMNHTAVLNAMQQCDFYVCNSNFETFGMTVAEALRAGKPVVSTKCGGPEEFLHEQNSILVNSKNEIELSSALLKMAGHYQNYDAKKLAGEMEEKFGRDTVRQQWISFYNGSLG